MSDRLFQATLGALDLFAVYLGDRLGLYRELADGGAATAPELAARTGTFERYLREWLEQQAVSSFLQVDNPGDAPADRRYRLPREHVGVLVDPDALEYEVHKAIDVARAARTLPALVDAFRTGEGVPPPPWEPEGRADYNRAVFVNLLGKEWLPSIEEVDARLRADPPALVADLGCGMGWSAISMAVAYPKIRVEGFDLDEAAIERARRNAAATGVADRVTFSARDASAEDLSGRYDLVTIFEALHDMSRPVEVLRAARGLLAPTGSVIVADERVGEDFLLPASDNERYMYGWSIMACLPNSLVDADSAATGAIMRPDTLRRYALQAGFEEAEILPIETDFWLFYRLTPPASGSPGWVGRATTR